MRKFFSDCFSFLWKTSFISRMEVGGCSVVTRGKKGNFRAEGSAVLSREAVGLPDVLRTCL